MSASGPPVLVLPGYGDSGPGHWQSLWEAEDGRFRRVLQRDWLLPERAEWLAALEREIAACAAPPVLVAHSLGCALVAARVAAAGGGGGLDGPLRCLSPGSDCAGEAGARTARGSLLYGAPVARTRRAQRHIAFATTL